MSASRFRRMLVPWIACAAAGQALAHCDGLDGPVVTAARAALADGKPERVLIWVREEDEPGIRRALSRARKVRAAGGEAKALADEWFFETLVRIHRAGEGEPYTGLKSAGLTATPILAADRAIADGCAAPLTVSLPPAQAGELLEKFEAVLAARKFPPADLAAGRAFVRAYVEFIHLAERLHAAPRPDGGHRPAGASHHTH